MNTAKKSMNSLSQKNAGNKTSAVFWIYIALILIFLAKGGIVGDLPDAGRFASVDSYEGLSKIDETNFNNLSDANNESNTQDTITISRIEVNVPIVTAQTTDVDQLHELLDAGAVIYPGSAGFGNDGQTVLMGHSAPANWPDTKHDTAFSRIVELVLGDDINIVYQGKAYTYSVVRSQAIKPGGNLSGGATAGSTLVMLTCWPPGSSQGRIAVEAKLVTD